MMKISQLLGRRDFKIVFNELNFFWFVHNVNMELVSYKPQTAPTVIKLLYSQSLKTVKFGQAFSTVYNAK